MKELHPNFSKYHKRVAARTGKQGYWVLAYADTGTGILNHIRAYHPDSSVRDEALSIAKVIGEHISTRAFEGSGFGLERVRDFIQDIRGFLFIETSGTSYSFDGLTKEEDESSGRSLRGTMVCIVMPVS